MSYFLFVLVECPANNVVNVIFLGKTDFGEEKNKIEKEEVNIPTSIMVSNLSNNNCEPTNSKNSNNDQLIDEISKPLSI